MTDNSNMISVINRITKEPDAKIVSKLIIDTVMDDRIENIENEDWKYVVKTMIYATRSFCDKGLKSKCHMLAQEAFSQEDLDGDDLIYGIDFIYKNPPDVLVGISEKSLKINPNIKTLKWSPIREK